MTALAEPGLLARSLVLPASAQDFSSSPTEREELPACKSCASPPQEGRETILLTAQMRWSARSLAERLQVLRGARHTMASQAEQFAAAMPDTLARSGADTLVAELLPLLDAMRFLERNARPILAPRHLGRRGRPLWLAGVQSEVRRVPLGHVLVIGPANFPLFLPGAQVMQALAAGNTVTWKPGAGGERVARIVASTLEKAGLPQGVLRITDESVEAAQMALAASPDKVIFTGSLTSGQKILHKLAETATPAVMELSGADAVVVLPSADLALVARAVAFGLRLNGGEVCMSPRRLIATPATLQALRPLLEAELAKVPPVVLQERTASLLRDLVDRAEAGGAVLVGAVTPSAQRPLLMTDAHPKMAIACSDVFAPVISLLPARDVVNMPEIVNDCPYALTTAVFGAPREARAMGEQLRVGTVLVNDLIAPTADPRVPFAGRGRSGFGATRGAEGLLEMTATKTILVRRTGSARHYDPVGGREMPLFAGMIGALHGGSLRARVKGLRTLASAGRNRLAS